MMLFDLTLIKGLIMIIKLNYIFVKYIWKNISNKLINKYIDLLNKIIICFYIVIYKKSNIFLIMF